MTEVQARGGPVGSGFFGAGCFEALGDSAEVFPHAAASEFVYFCDEDVEEIAVV